MSAPSFVEDVPLIGQHLFDHTPVIRNEIEKFAERFEKNERHKEFDGILRASHGLVEAYETPVEGLFEAGKMKKLTKDINTLAERIKLLTVPNYKDEHDQYLADITASQRAYLELCRNEAQKKMRAAAQK